MYYFEIKLFIISFCQIDHLYFLCYLEYNFKYFLLDHFLFIYFNFTAYHIKAAISNFIIYLHMYLKNKYYSIS
jgi:hypothetical protein